MKIAIEKPPLYEHILQAGMAPSNDAIYTYGDTVYNPSGQTIPDHLITHEECHMHQQGNNPEQWWSRYLDDIYFRIDQEAEAYGAQYAFVCNVMKDRNQRWRFLYQLGTILSGPTYGSVINPMKACAMIKDYAKKIKPNL